MIIDIRGKEIKVGSIVAYPDRHGSRLWLKSAKVIAIVLRPVTTSVRYVPVLQVKNEKSGRVSVVGSLDRVVKVR